MVLPPLAAAMAGICRSHEPDSGIPMIEYRVRNLEVANSPRIDDSNH